MSVTAAVWAEVLQVPLGQPFPSTSVRHCGSRASVDQALSRLVVAGSLDRLCRGMYVRPRKSRPVGSSSPSVEEIVKVRTAACGETIDVHGAEAARRLGLTSQVPLRVIYLTSGRSRTLDIGGVAVTFRHTSPRWLTLAGTAAGLAATALRYMGRNDVDGRTIERVRKAIGEEQFVLLSSTPSVTPAWLGDLLQHSG